MFTLSLEEFGHEEDVRMLSVLTVMPSRLAFEGFFGEMGTTCRILSFPGHRSLVSLFVHRPVLFFIVDHVRM